MLENIVGSVTTQLPSFGGLLLCTAVSLFLGFAVALIYMFRNKYSKSMAMSLVIIPAIVQIIIMLVNGNIGTGVAVAGAFSLVRFRSLPGNARDIISLFFAMALGFFTGMGYLFYAFVFLIVIGSTSLLLVCTGFGQKESSGRVLRITIPENLDYDGLFEDIFEEYTVGHELERVKTSNMGSLYELTYLVHFKSASVPKAFMDALRCRNGNLNIQISREKRDGEEL